MMRKKFYTVIGILLFSALVVSCGDRRQEEAVKQQRDAYVSQVESRLTGFDAKMQEFEKKGEAIPVDKKEEFNKTIEALKQKRDATAKSLDAVKTAEGAQWESAKAQTDAALAEMENSLNQALSAFP